MTAEEILERRNKAYLTALNAMWDLVDALTAERNYYKQQCEEKENKL